MDTELKAWVTTELKNRHWSYRELARQTGLSHSLISQTLSGHMKASADFCLKLGLALEVSPETVMRKAGLLPSITPDDEIIHEAVELIRSFPVDKRRLALRLLRSIIDQGDQ